MRSTLVVSLVVAGLLAGVAGYWFGGRPAPAAVTAASAVANADEGTPPPAGISLTDLDGKTHTLEDWRGKLVLMNFWATWCTPCLKEIPLLVKAQTEYGARGLQVIAPAVDDPDEVRRAAGQLKIGYPVMTGTPEQMIGLLGDFGNTAGALPFTIVIGANGKIVHQQLGEFDAESLKKLVEANLPRS